MPDIGYPYYFFGSPDSVDVDVLVDHPATNGTISDSVIVAALKDQFEEIADWNLSIISIENRIVTRTMQRRGTIDCVHNSLFHTYQHHLEKQQFVNPLTGPVQRHILLAVQQCVRTLLAITGSTNHRLFYKEKISPILKSGNWQKEVELLSLLRYDEPFFDNAERNQNLHKSLAFDIGQTISLINGKEIYIKKEVTEQHPVLAPLIRREETNVNDAMLPKITELQILIQNMDINQPEKFVINHGKESVNTKFGTSLS